jgi:hypothetical protein
MKYWVADGASQFAEWQGYGAMNGHDETGERLSMWVGSKGA